MRLIGVVCLLGASMGWVAAESAAEAAPARKAGVKKGSGKKKGAVLGVVESVSKDSLTVKVKHGKRRSRSVVKRQKTFQIGATTKVYRNGKAVGLAALDPGKRVVVHTVAGQRQQVARVDIISGKKNKKKA